VNRDGHEPGARRTVMLIHGAWLTPACWDRFRGRYEAKGVTCLTPAWPLLDRPIAELQRSPHPDLGMLTVGRIVDHYASLIRALTDPPILIGHSFGGLFVQMLLDRGLGAAGVAIDPAPCAGVFPTPTVLYGAFPVFAAVKGWTRALTMTLPQFAWSFMHLSTPDEQRDAYERYVVPTPGRLYYQAALFRGTRVNFRNDRRAPLLLVAGEKDRTVARSMVESAYRKHRQSESVTAFRAYPGRTHFLIATPGWEEVADEALEWAAGHAPTGAA
jgi:pimeloyl-ACP methyl ester carboxylesterase